MRLLTANWWEDHEVGFTKDHGMKGFPALALTCAAALLLAACGGSSTNASTSTSSAVASTPVTTASTQTSGTTQTATTPTTTTSTTATSSGPPLCVAADLQLSFLGGQAATGHGLLGFELRNTGTTTCHTGGYPGVLFLSRSGAPLPTVPTHTTQDFFGALPLASLTVAPGTSISFRLGVTHGIASNAGCTTAYGLQVIPPNDTATLRTTIADGAYECRTVTVSPVVAGTAAYP